MSCKNKGLLSPIQTQKLWNDPETAVDDYLQGFTIMHPGTVILEGTRAVLRKDYTEMNGKVRLISGGGAGNEPTHVGFVGPGMLTAAIVGDIFSAPPSDSILRLIQTLGADHSPGVLIIVQNYTGYRINFGLATSRAQNKGLHVAMLTVSDDTCLRSFEKTAGRRGLAATLFIHKIAGAMAEEGKSLGDICTLCNRIMNSGGIASIGLCTRVLLAADTCACTQDSSTMQMEFGSGIHGEPGVKRISFATVKEIVCQLIDIMTDEASEVCFKLAGCDNPDEAADNVALIIDNLGGSSQMELGIFAKEVVEQLTSRGLRVERLYAGTLMTVLDTGGFQFSVLKLSSELNLTKYLDAPTAAPAWPKVLDGTTLGSHSNASNANTVMTALQLEDSEVSSGNGIPDVEPRGPVLDDRTAQVFLIILIFACEGLISCAEMLNIMDKDSGDGDCGTSLAQGANAIKSAVKEKQISASRPFVALRQISYIIERVMGGIMGGLYSLFFDAGAKEFGKRSDADPVDVCMWLNALAAGNRAVIEYGHANLGDRTMLDPLLTIQDHLSKALKINSDPIKAFGDAVKAAESRIIETIKLPARVGRASLIRCKQFEYPDPGAHAVGIWMRAAYEGVRLKLSCQCKDQHQ